MKMTKVLIGAAVLAAISFGFMSCSEEDDTEGAIEKQNSKNYSINFTNTNDSIYRAYKSTSFKHNGALVKVTIENQTASMTNATATGTMGVIWDLQDNEVNKNNKDFFIAAFNNGRSTDGKIALYVSKLWNVSDLQANNFGADAYTTEEAITAAIQAGKAAEYEVIPLTSTKTDDIVRLDASEYVKDDGTLSFWLNVFTAEEAEDNYTNDIDEDELADEGAFFLQLWAEDAVDEDTKDFKAGATPINGTLVIDSDITGYEEVPQNKLAVYANVYPKQTLTGSWFYIRDYAEAEVIED